MLAYLYEATFSAEAKDLVKQWIIGFLEFFLEAQSSSHNANFNGSIIGKKLVETQLFACIFLEYIPVLNEIYQFAVALNVLQAKNKNHLSLKSRLGFVRLEKPSVKKRAYKR
jgi:hypothetical protein